MKFRRWMSSFSSTGKVQPKPEKLVISCRHCSQPIELSPDQLYPAWTHVDPKTACAKAQPVRHQCRHCLFASDSMVICPSECCHGAQMVEAPDALLDSEMFSAHSWEGQCKADRGKPKKPKSTIEFCPQCGGPRSEPHCGYLDTWS
jgi:hypothetical protein